MTRRTADDREWDDEDRDGDGIDSAGWDNDDEDEPTVPCPYCRREIFEDAVRCPHCGEYLSDEDAPAGPRPWLIVVGVLLSLAAVWVWIVNR
jgi:hypothetical protein